MEHEIIKCSSCGKATAHEGIKGETYSETEYCWYCDKAFCFGCMDFRSEDNLCKKCSPYHLSTEQWVDMKEMISATIFDYEPEGINFVVYNRLHEEDCNVLGELIMEKLGYTLDILER